MSIIYIGWAGVAVLAILGILGVAEDIAHEMRAWRNGTGDVENPAKPYHEGNGS